MLSIKSDRIKYSVIWFAAKILMLLKFNKKFNKRISRCNMKKIGWIFKIDDFDLEVQNEFSHKSTENILVIDDLNYFNSQSKVDTEEQIKFHLSNFKAH